MSGISIDGRYCRSAAVVACNPIFLSKVVGRSNLTNKAEGTKG